MTTPADPEADKPGKIRTWWHPLLAGVLRWQLGSHYELFEEVPVGKKPLQIDFLLLHKFQGELSEHARELFPEVAEYLNEYTLVELKSPSDTLRPGDFRTLIAYALLYCAQQQPHLDPARMTLMVIAPRLSRPYEEEMRLLGVEARQEHPGVWRLQGGMLGAHPGWLLESTVLFGPDHPVLSLLSPRFLQQPQQTYEMLRRAGYTDLVVYMAQQIQQFRRLGKEFAMQHLGSEDEMAQVWRDLLAGMTAEERLEGLSIEERLKGLPPEERLKGLPPEERLKGLPPEERLKGLTPEQLERLKVLLQQQTKVDDTGNPR
jgi:hypothetical protein